MNYTQEQIELIDKVFNYHVGFHCTQTERNNPYSDLFSEMYGIDPDVSEFAIKEMCLICAPLDILKYSVSGYGYYSVINMDKTKCLHFQSQGGIFGLYQRTKEQTSQNQIRQSIEDEKLVAERDVAIFNAEWGKRITIIGVVLAILTFVLSVITSSYFDNQTKRNLQIQVDSLKYKLSNVDSLYRILQSSTIQDSMKQ